MRHSPPSSSVEPIGLLLSGGIDSSILLGHLLAEGRLVQPFYLLTGCVWEDCELRAVRRLVAELDHWRLSELVVFDMPLEDLYGNHWSISGRDVPDHHTPDEAVYLPGRNLMLLAKPMLWCQLHGIKQLALATLAANPFDDATPSFFASIETVVRLATGGGVEIVRPFERLAKRQVLAFADDVPLAETFSCLAPVDGLHCGECNKCAERAAVFEQLEQADPTLYAVGPRLRGGISERESDTCGAS